MIAFNKYYNHFNILSILLISGSLLLLIFKGLNYGIDFKGGTLIELRSSDSKISVSSLRDKFNQMDLEIDLDRIIDKLLSVRNQKPGKIVNL